MCGSLIRPLSSQAQSAAANARAYAQDRRARNTRTVVFYGAGLGVLAALRVWQHNLEYVQEDARYMLAGAPLGMVVYWLCCLIFIGFDQPLWVQLLRLGSIYVVVLALIAVIVALPMSGCMTLIIAPAAAMVVYVMLLKRELELDQLDAGLVAILSGASAFGGVVASYYLL